MAATVKIPGVGAVPTKYAVAGGVAVVGIAGFFWIRHLNAPPAEEEPATADFTEGGDYVYGDPGQAFATDYAYDGGAYPYPTYQTPAYGNNVTVQTPDPVTNTEWTARSIEHLEMVGVESQAASLAVSRYLLKECLTATQADIVRQAVGRLGPPPQGAFSIIVCPTTPPPPPNPGSGEEHVRLPAPSRIFATYVTKSSIRFGWTAVPGATKYVVQQTGSSGQWQTIGYSADNQHTRGGLRSGWTHRFRVAAISDTNDVGAWSSTLARATNKR